MQKKMDEKCCPNCGDEIIGRADKKYCDQYCKSAFHYKKAQIEQPAFYTKIDNQLRTNRLILKEYNKARKSTVRAEEVLHKYIGTNYNPSI